MSLTKLSHLSLKSDMKFQLPVQKTDFTGLCFQILLLLDTVASCLIVCLVSVLRFVSLRVMHSLPALLFNQKSLAISELLRKYLP